jgi:hypothetical protein
MGKHIVRIGNHVINLDAFAGAHWEGRKLILRYIGGGFETFNGTEGDLVWSIVSHGVTEAGHGTAVEMKEAI